jgi:hypothetical protein
MEFGYSSKRYGGFAQRVLQLTRISRLVPLFLVPGRVWSFRSQNPPGFAIVQLIEIFVKCIRPAGRLF